MLEDFSVHEINVTPINEDINKELLRIFKGERSGWYCAAGDSCLLPSKYQKEWKNFHECAVRDDDIWISTFPRSGTTLTQDLVWLLRNGFDFDTSKTVNLWDRSPFLEFDLFFHDESKEIFKKENANKPENLKLIEDMSTPGYQVIESKPSPRVIKTHFPLRLLPKGVHEKKCKIIYVARNPKDVVISNYYLFQQWRTTDYVSSFATFWEMFKRGHVPWGPYWNHVLEAWNHRNVSNVLFLFYEDMTKDLEGEIYKIADFLSIPAQQEKVKALVDHLSVASFSKNPAVNFEHLRSVGILKDGKGFIRTGTTLSQELIWLLLNKFDYKQAEETNLWLRSPFFEFHTFAHHETIDQFMLQNDNDEGAQRLITDMTMSALERLKDMGSPRLIKTHLPISLLPKGVKSNKIIYVARNPKDILPSYYYLLRLWKISGYSGSFQKFWKQFKNGHVPWAPFWAHVIEAWNLREMDNILFLFYEEIVEDISQVIIKIADFLEIEVTEEQVDGLAEHMAIPNFSKNKSVNMEGLRKVGILKENEPGFIRTGKRRQRPEEYTSEIAEEVEEWIEGNYATTDMRFPLSQ